MEAGTHLGGRYQLADVIGTGGMSDVYAGTDTLLGRDVAVKMMRPDLARDETFLERFRREAQNAAKLNHHAIVAVYDTGQTSKEEGSVPYIVMERVHGRTLRDIVRDDGPMEVTRAAAVMADVAEALHFSHEAGIIHRDVKPANIMITQMGTVKVMDFGIARALGDSTSSMTQTAAVIGTAQYLSPEQARGKSADARSDIYATGCVFYELVTGEAPFHGESPFSVAYQHVQDDPTPPSQVGQLGLSPAQATGVDAVVLTAMAKDPSDRYEDAREFAADLRLLANNRVPLAAHQHVNQPELADEASPGSSASAGPSGAGAIGAGAAGAAGVAGAGAGAAAARRATPSASDAEATNVMPRATESTGNGQLQHPPSTVPPVAAHAPMSADAPHGRDPHAHQVPATGATPPTGAPGAAGSPAASSHQYVEDEDAHYDDQSGSRIKGWTRAVWILVLLTVLGVGGYVAYQYVGTSSSAPEQVSIPTVKGKTQAEAMALLNAKSLKITTVEKADPKVPRGIALGTTPAAGSQVPQDSNVTLTISTGKEIVEVPDVKDKDTEEAQRILKEAGMELNTQVKEESSETVEKGKIIDQSPSAGTQATKGTKVTITVSKGEAQVRVPVVTDQSLQNARGNLDSAGFTVQVQEVDSTKPEGTVLSASNEGQNLPKGSTIVVKVSKGNQFTMPDLTGQTYAQALATLQRAGWRAAPENLIQERQDPPDLTRLNQIASQSVPPGRVIGTTDAVTVKVHQLLP